ncbi:hypothetical protein C8J56DRAFT_917682 [Mycena floridula]|nr:hypothetical protein C8J56DRAFT_917682 [Mycena floridula]
MLSIFVVLLTLGLVNAAQTFWPAAIPLAVRSPYFNSWLDTRSGNAVQNQWPQFWTDSHILGWAGLVKVDAKTYRWIGNAGDGTNFTSFQVTPTRTILTVEAGPVELQITILSPIEPSDLALQSFPFSYVYIDAKSTDGNSHAVSVYADLTGEWLANDISQFISWKTTETSSIVYHEASRTNANVDQEVGEMSESSTLYYAASEGNGMSYQTENADTLRSTFTTKGVLPNTIITDASRVISNNWPSFAFSTNFGTITSTSSPAVWAMGLVSDPIVYMTQAGTQTRVPYFWSKYATIADAINAFMADFPNAKTRAEALDQKILAAASAISTNYADLVSLSARQTFASLQTTVQKFSSGGFNTSDVLMFMKDVGNSRRTNAVENLFASFPAFLYLNSSYGGYLLEPMLRFQSTMAPSQVYAAPDLGTTYPIVQGNTTSGPFRGIDDSGSMLIMAYAHARFSGDSSLITRYYSTLKLWADYLVTNTQSPTGFQTADGLSNTNMTNLIIKGVLGIKAMAEISTMVPGQSSNADLYQATAARYVQQWTTAAASTGHLLSTYDNTGSWALIYNLWADKWLGLNLVDSSIYTEQDSFYSKQASTSGLYGLAYDSFASGQVKSHWTMLTAASSGNSTRNLLIDIVHQKLGTNATAGINPTTWDPTSGSVIGGSASPAQGAMFAMLAMNLPVKLSPGSFASSGGSKSANIGAIVGGVVGGIVVIAILIFAFLTFKKRRARKYDAPYAVTYDPAQPLSHTFSSNANLNAYEMRDQYHDQSPYHDQQAYPNTAASTPYHEQPYPLQPSYPLEPVRQLPAEPAHRRYPSNSAVSSVSGTVQLAYAQSETSSSAPGQAGPLPSKRRPSDQGPLGLVSPTSTGTSEFGGSAGSDPALRSEVEALRREMAELKAGIYQPPPQYN